MLHILLLIFKIIGILLLLILGLLILVLLTVLLVPLRYRLVVEHGDAFYLKGRAHWLLYLIHAEVTHIEGVFHIRLRVLGFILFDNLKPKGPKKKKEKIQKKNAKVRKKKKRRALETKEKQDKPTVSQNANEESIGMRLEKESARTELKEEKADLEPEVNIDLKQEAKINLNQEEKGDLRKGAIPDRLATESTLVKQLEKDTEDSGKAREKNEKSSEETPNRRKVIPKVFYQAGSFFKKLYQLLIRLLQILQRIINKIKQIYIKLKDRIKGILATLSNVKRRWNLIYDFLQEEMNKEGFQATWHSVKRLLKHIMPTKLRSTLIFGTGDPCSTGQLLGLMGILYSFYGDRIRITPDFQNKRMEGKHEARGRIRMLTVLIIVVKLLMDKRFKQLQRNIIILKEAL